MMRFIKSLQKLSTIDNFSDWLIGDKMKKCPNCHQERIPLKWILFGKAKGQKGRCYICENCGEKIRKKNYLGYVLDFNYETIIVVMLGLSFLTHNTSISFYGAPILLIIIIMASSFFASLQIADESYCQGDMSKIGAFFGLIGMIGIIAYLIYFFIIQPFFR